MKRWLLAMLGVCVLSSAYAAEPIEVLVLGAYHMGNPGQDLHNAKADDVLTEQRQKEIRAVVDRLARFAPTRVAVEWHGDKYPGHALPAYRDYLQGKEKDERDEIKQIAFRLAAQMKHQDVFGIDVQGEFPFEAVQAFAAANGQSARLDSMMEATAAKVKQFEADQTKQTVGQLLRAINAPKAIVTDHGFYMDMLNYGKDQEQPGAKLVGAWYVRNLAICARLVQIATPGDRIVVLYGGGHSYLLRQCVREMPGWKLIEANAYLPK
jgi:Family of unknown function (DUF5694)